MLSHVLRASVRLVRGSLACMDCRPWIICSRIIRQAACRVHPGDDPAESRMRVLRAALLWESEEWLVSMST